MRRALIALLLACSASLAFAGQPCEEKPLTVDEARQSLALAQRTVDALDASGAQVALVARAGQDLSRYGLRYSHAGIAWRDHPAGRWVVVHLLNDCGTPQSALYNDGLGSFFLTDLHRFDAQLIVPSHAVQQRLADLLASRMPFQLHEPTYSMLSYAWSTRYQNSNQWVLEMLAAAGATPGAVQSRREAQRWLNEAGYRPVAVTVGAAARLGARMFRNNVAFDDHPSGLRMRGSFGTVTVDGIAQFVRSHDREARIIPVFAQAQTP